MKKIQKITETAIKDLKALNSDCPTGTTRKTNNTLTNDLALTDVLSQLKAIHPAWRAGIKTDEDLQAYADQLVAALLDNNITTNKQLQIGYKRSRQISSDFLPNPGRFANLCRIIVAPCHKEFKDTDHNKIEQLKSSPERFKTEIEKLKRINRNLRC